MKRQIKLLAVLLSVALIMGVFSVLFTPLTAIEPNEADDTSEDIFDCEEAGDSKFLNFESGDSDALFANDNMDASIAGLSVLSNPLKDDLNSSDNILKVTCATKLSQNKNRGIFLFSNNYIPKDSELYSVNFKLLLECDDTDYNYRYPTFVYDYTDENNWRGIALISIKGKVRAMPVGMPSGNAGWTQPTYTAGFTGREFRTVNSDATQALPYKSWISVSATYSRSEVKITLVGENGYMQNFNQVCNLNDSPKTRVGFTSMGRTLCIDDIYVNLSGNDAAMSADNFLKKNANIFNYRASTLSVDDNVVLTTALNDYNALSDEAKTYISHKKVYLDELQKRMDVIKDDLNYSHSSEKPAANYWSNHNTFVFEDNFDDASSLSNYVDIRDTGTWLGDTAVIKSDNPFSNSAFGVTESAFKIRDELLPEKAKMQTVEYDWTVQSDTPVPYFADANLGYPFYFNADNYYRFLLSNFPDDAGLEVFMRYRSTYVKNGTPTPYGPFGLLKNSVEPGTKLHVCYIYGGKTIDVVITNGDTTIYEGVITVADQRGQFVLAGCDSRFKVWYDNLKITYTKGEWDLDKKSNDLNVYFTGSTIQNPGDVVLINGDNIGSLITGAEIMPLSSNVNDRSYYDYQAFNEYGVIEGTYSADPADIPWDGNKSKIVEIIQKTDDSVKFVIPDTDSSGNPMPSGVYAVKLFGQDNETNYIQKIITINSPHIDYTVGDDGPRISPGGYIEVVGKMIAFPLSNTDAVKDYGNLKAVLADKSSGAVIKDLPIETVFSNYNVRLSVPNDTPKGDYELWIYSGYGWSVPYNVTVAESVKTQLLNQQTITVTDNIYTGISVSGDKNQNATPYVQQLLDILAGQGGGVLYFPKGIYRFTQPLIVPEKVCIVGNDVYDTVFIWTSFNWNYNELPSYLIGMESNSIIKNIDIYVHRTGGIIRYFGDDIENVYLDHIRTYSQKLSGTTTAGCHSGSWYNTAELLLLNATESRSWTIGTPDNGKLVNYQMTDCDFNDYGVANGYGGQGMRLTYTSGKSSYYQIYDSQFNCGWSPSQGDKVIVRNFDFSNACFSIAGKGVLYDRCYIHDDTTNNRELFVADLSPIIPAFTGINADTTDPTGCRYFLPLGNVNPMNIDNLQLYVVSGQGMGQTRTVTNCTATSTNGIFLVTFNAPFQVSPNRNSTCIMRWARENMYFVNNRYYNGSTVGFYGGVAGAVFDGNSYQRVGDQYLWPCWGDVNWYVSYNNDKTVYDPFFIVSDGTEAKSGFTRFIIYGGSTKYLRSVVFRNCDFAGRDLELNTSKKNGLVDLLLDKCSFSNSKLGVYSNTVVYMGEGIDGVLLYNLSFTNVDVPYKNLENSLVGKNSVYTQRAKIVGDNYQKCLLGDVNLDGKVTLKDCTMIKLYLAKKIVLTDEQLALADRDGNGTVNLKDATAIVMLDILV